MSTGAKRAPEVKSRTWSSAMMAITKPRKRSTEFRRSRLGLVASGAIGAGMSRTSGGAFRRAASVIGVRYARWRERCEKRVAKDSETNHPDAKAKDGGLPSTLKICTLNIYASAHALVPGLAYLANSSLSDKTMRNQLDLNSLPVQSAGLRDSSATNLCVAP